MERTVLPFTLGKVGQTYGKIAGYRIEKDVDGIGRYVTDSISRKTESSYMGLLHVEQLPMSRI